MLAPMLLIKAVCGFLYCVCTGSVVVDRAHRVGSCPNSWNETIAVIYTRKPFNRLIFECIKLNPRYLSIHFFTYIVQSCTHPPIFCFGSLCSFPWYSGGFRLSWIKLMEGQVHIGLGIDWNKSIPSIETFPVKRYLQWFLFVPRARTYDGWYGLAHIQWTQALNINNLKTFKMHLCKNHKNHLDVEECWHFMQFNASIHMMGIKWSTQLVSVSL